MFCVFVFRYASPGMPPRTLPCRHGAKNHAFYCEELQTTQISRIHRVFYSHVTKVDQDNFILNHTKAIPTKRVRDTNATRRNDFSIEYYVQVNNQRKRICQKAFLSIFMISKNRVQGVVHRNFQSGKSASERRGGDRKGKTHAEKKIAVISFVKKLKCNESHYCREKSSKRVYLSPDLNIRKLWSMYQKEHERDNLQVTKYYFRKIFRTRFNIGFGSPATDQCSTCLSLNERIKRCNNDVKKVTLRTERNVHSMKAKAFYRCLQQNNPTMYTFSFDCQKNQVLPRVPDQSAYYSRQLYKYNLTIVEGHSKAPQTRENVYIFHWNENEQKKGSNEVASAVYDFLLNFAKIPLTVKKVRCFCDGCGGQNKNTTMVSMLGFWLLNIAPSHVEEVEIIFPIVGHSFLPSDRVFGRIEKDIRKKGTIVQPEEYVEIFSKQGRTISLAGKVFDWKTAADALVHKPGKWHFKFSATKRFSLKRNSCNDNVIVKGEALYYNSVCAYKTITKGRKKLKNLRPNPLPAEVVVAPLKIRDVEKLLQKHFGVEWETIENLSYYKDVIQRGNQGRPAEENQECEPMYYDDNNFI